MPILVSFLALALLSPVSLQGCDDFKDTLLEYYIQRYGERDLRVTRYSKMPPRDAKCRKLQWDQRMISCRFWEAPNPKRYEDKIKTDASGVPLFVRQSQNKNPRRIVGGEEGKKKNIEIAWSNHRKWLAKYRKGKAVRDTWNAAWKDKALELKKEGCRDMFGGGEYKPRKMTLE